MSVFRITSATDLPRKRFNAIRTPKGTPKADAKKVATTETLSEVHTIKYTDESKLSNNAKALYRELRRKPKLAPIVSYASLRSNREGSGKIFL